MSDTSAVSESVLRFARQHISSAARIIQLKSRAPFNRWVAWVDNDNEERFKLQIREVNGRLFVEFAEARPPNLAVRPSVPLVPKDDPRSRTLTSVRHHLDTRYDRGDISYSEYMRRLRIIGQR